MSVDEARGISMAFARPMALGLARWGVAPAAWLGEVGTLPSGFVPDARLARALHVIAAREGKIHFGLELAEAIPLGWLGSLDYRFSTSATLGEALTRMVPELNVLTDAIRYEIEIDELVHARLMHLTKRPEIATTMAILTDVTMALVVRRMRDVLGDAARMTFVRFMRAPAGSARPYESYFGCPVTFGADVDEVAFPRDLLSAPLLTADAGIAAALAATAVRPSPQDTFLDEVRGIVRASLPDGSAAFEAVVVAQRLGMSSRSLHRKLRERGASLSGLIDETRREAADSLLANGGVLLCDVAYRLGFSGLRPFYRAFHRWTGTSPRAFQKARR